MNKLTKFKLLATVFCATFFLVVSTISIVIDFAPISAFAGEFKGFETPAAHACLDNPTLECVKAMIDQQGLERPVSKKLSVIEARLPDTKKCEVYNDHARFPIWSNHPWGGVGGYLDEEAHRRFKPDTEWNQTMTAWKRTADKLPEPERSDNFVRISKLYEDIGRNEDAKEEFLKTVAPSKESMRDFWQVRDKIGEELWQHRIQYSYTGQLAHAEDLVRLKSYADAIPLLYAERAVLTAKTPSGKEDIGFWDRKQAALISISKLLYVAGDAKGAAETAELSAKCMEPFECSKIFREAGQKERAIEVLNRRKNYVRDESTLSCSGNSYIGASLGCAKELVFLGMPELAYKKEFFGCSRLWPREYCGFAFRELYKTAIEAGEKPPDKEEYFPTIDSQKLPSLSSGLALFHFGRGEFVLGQPFFHDAVARALDKDYDGNGEGHCEIAGIAYTVGEKDVLDDLFKAAIRAITKKYEHEEARKAHYRDTVKCFLKFKD